MTGEMTSLNKNQTWVFVKRPGGNNIVEYKWIYKKKEEISEVEDARFKERLVVKSFSQKDGLYYNKIFSSIMKHISIRVLLTLISQFDLEL